MPPPKLITPIDFVISGEDVLLLQYAYCDETSSPRTRSFIRQFAISFGSSLPCGSLRHAVLAYSAGLLPEGQFRETSNRHAQKATRSLMRKLETPSVIGDADVFAASMLMWMLWIQNRREDAMTHANGVMAMLNYIWANSEEGDLSDMLKVFGPLAYGDAKFYVAMGLHDSDLRLPNPQHNRRRTTFNQRVKYHREIIRSGSANVAWLSATKFATTDSLWDVQRLLLSYLSDVCNGDAIENAGRVQDAVQYILMEFNDPDLQHSLAAIEWQGNRSEGGTVEEEVTNYLSLQLLSIQLLITILSAITILDGLRSPKAKAIAKTQLARGRSRPLLREGPAHEFYTWAFVIDLGLVGLAFSPQETPEGMFRRRRGTSLMSAGCLWVREELQRRGKPKLAKALEIFWERPNLEAAGDVIMRVVGQSSGTISEIPPI
jgi:hypothetical protein